MTKKPHSPQQHSQLGLDRIVFFSDAVMAIAITLLVLDIKMPEATNDLGRAVVEFWPKLLGYIVSFWVIALYWLAHHRCFRYIHVYDRRLIYLNFLFLMFIAFMPFPTSLLFNNPIQSASVILYATTAAGIGLSLSLLWVYADRHQFLTSDTPRDVVRDIRLNLVLPPLVFLASAVVAIFNADLAMYLWLLLIPVYFLRRHTDAAMTASEAA